VRAQPELTQFERPVESLSVLVVSPSFPSLARQLPGPGPPHQPGREATDLLCGDRGERAPARDGSHGYVASPYNLPCSLTGLIL
jgi:hypothetical protein